MGNKNELKQDIDFISEIQDKIKKGWNYKDYTHIEYALKMLDDWKLEFIERLKKL